MAEINHRYLKDNDGEEFYPITHVDAVQGFDQTGTDTALTDINDKINQLQTTIGTMQKQMDGMALDVISLAGDTGWVDYTVANAEKNGALSAGYKCMIREVSVGFAGAKNFKLRTIRVNISKVPHNTTIAQLPTGFIDQTVRFSPAVSSGHTPPIISVATSGEMKVYFPTEDRAGDQWVYGQYTWIVD